MSATEEDRAYYEAVEAAFIRRRGTPFLLSPSDFALLQEWRALGVPLEAVEAGIDEAFTRREERKAIGRVNSLSYCRDAVLEAWERRAETARGKRPPDAGAEVDAKARARRPSRARLEAARSRRPDLDGPLGGGPRRARAPPGDARTRAGRGRGLARAPRPEAGQGALRGAARGRARRRSTARSPRSSPGAAARMDPATAREDDEGADAPQRPRAPRSAAAEPAVSGAPAQVRIEKLAPTGEGIVRSSDGVGFVDGALPGELVATTLYEVRKRFWRGSLRAVLEPSPDRVDGPARRLRRLRLGALRAGGRADGQARALPRDDAADRQARPRPLRRAARSRRRAPGYRLRDAAPRGRRRARVLRAGDAPGRVRPTPARRSPRGPRALLPGDGRGHRVDAAPRCRRSPPSRTFRERRRLIRATVSGDPAAGGGARARAFRGSSTGSASWTADGQAAARARGARSRSRRGRPRVLGLGGQLLPGATGSSCPSSSPTSRPRRRRSARGSRSTPSAAWVSSRERCSRPGTGASPSRPTPGRSCDARRTTRALARRRAVGDRRGPDSTRFLAEDDRRFACVVADPPRAGLGAELARELARAQRERLRLRLLRPGDARARSARDPRRGLRDPRRPALRPLRLHPSRGGARRASSARRDPAGPRRGRGAGGAGGGLSGRGDLPRGLVGRRDRRRGGRCWRRRRPPLWPSCERRAAARGVPPGVRGASGSRRDSSRGGRASPSRRRAARGRLPRTRRALRRGHASSKGCSTDFWSGEPPRARDDAARRALLGAGDGWRPFPAEVVVFVSGEAPALVPGGSRRSRARDRAPRAGGAFPASDRDVPLPWPRYRISVKSARLVERRARYAPLAPDVAQPLALRARCPPAGSPAFDRDVRGPLAALLLGRTSELDRGMVARYRRGGLYHLLVVSGLHVVLAAGLVVFALRLLARSRASARDAAAPRGGRSCSCSSAARIRPPCGPASWSRSFS